MLAARCTRMVIDFSGAELGTGNGNEAGWRHLSPERILFILVTQDGGYNCWFWRYIFLGRKDRHFRSKSTLDFSIICR